MKTSMNRNIYIKNNVCKKPFPNSILCIIQGQLFRAFNIFWNNFYTSEPYLLIVWKTIRNIYMQVLLRSTVYSDIYVAVTVRERIEGKKTLKLN